MYTFRKEERLCSRKLLDKLFKEGSSFLIYPFRVVYLPENTPSGAPAQIVIIVPKRRFKRAAIRNLIKRRVREAYRLNKEALLYPSLLEHNVKLLLSLQYVGKEIADFKFLEKKLKSVMSQLSDTYAHIHR